MMRQPPPKPTNSPEAAASSMDEAMRAELMRLREEREGIAGWLAQLQAKKQAEDEISADQLSGLIIDALIAAWQLRPYRGQLPDRQHQSWQPLQQALKQRALSEGLGLNDIREIVSTFSLKKGQFFYLVRFWDDVIFLPKEIYKDAPESVGDDAFQEYHQQDLFDLLRVYIKFAEKVQHQNEMKAAVQAQERKTAELLDEKEAMQKALLSAREAIDELKAALSQKEEDEKKLQRKMVVASDERNQYETLLLRAAEEVEAYKNELLLARKRIDSLNQQREFDQNETQQERERAAHYEARLLAIGTQLSAMNEKMRDHAELEQSLKQTQDFVRTEQGKWYEAAMRAQRSESAQTRLETEREELLVTIEQTHHEKGALQERLSAAMAQVDALHIELSALRARPLEYDDESGLFLPAQTTSAVPALSEDLWQKTVELNQQLGVALLSIESKDQALEVLREQLVHQVQENTDLKSRLDGLTHTLAQLEDAASDSGAHASEQVQQVDELQAEVNRFTQMMAAQEAQHVAQLAQIKRQWMADEERRGRATHQLELQIDESRKEVRRLKGAVLEQVLKKGPVNAQPVKNVQVSRSVEPVETVSIVGESPALSVINEASATWQDFEKCVEYPQVGDCVEYTDVAAWAKKVRQEGFSPDVEKYDLVVNQGVLDEAPLAEEVRTMRHVVIHEEEHETGDLNLGKLSQLAKTNPQAAVAKLRVGIKLLLTLGYQEIDLQSLQQKKGFFHAQGRTFSMAQVGFILVKQLAKEDVKILALDSTWAHESSSALFGADEGEHNEEIMFLDAQLRQMTMVKDESNTVDDEEPHLDR